MSHGKRYQNAAKLVEAKRYTLADAVALLLQMPRTKFDETVELHMNLGIDPRHSDQQVRNTVLLPAGLGKTVRILVFAESEAARAAEAAGANIVGGDELLDKIQRENWTEFDAALATTDMMKKVGRVARVLGPRGLMPNPKAGTVVAAEDLPRAINELKAGRVEFRNDKTGNLHIPVGKASFAAEKLVENIQAVIDAVVRSKPSTVKGIYVHRVTLCSTMSPAITLEFTA
jgi:large subunit ribosomal protein L1